MIYDLEMIKKIKETSAKQMAEDLVSIQPMTGDIFKRGNGESELKEAGYKPVSRIGLMWIK